MKPERLRREFAGAAIPASPDSARAAGVLDPRGPVGITGSRAIFVIRRCKDREKLMPFSPARPCSTPGCPQLVPRGQYRCEQHERTDRRRRDAAIGSAAARGYDHQWRKRRAAHLASEPLCRMCRDKGLIVPATVADHIVPHRGDKTLFMGELQSLCTRCHASTKQSQESGID
jgi:5-methylcytosine-specific restriction protein A